MLDSEATGLYIGPLFKEKRVGDEKKKTGQKENHKKIG